MEFIESAHGVQCSSLKQLSKIRSNVKYQKYRYWAGPGGPCITGKPSLSTLIS